MQTRDITFSLPVDLILDAKVYAAQHDTTVDALVSELLREKVTAEVRERSRRAAERILEIAREGPLFTGDPRSIKREDLYRNFDHLFPNKSDQ